MKRDLKDFFKRIVKGSRIIPPENCIKAFTNNFSDSANIEWYDGDQQYEAIFYRNELEHTALFSNSGSLIEYRMVLPEGTLPIKLRAYLDERGEIMNRVLINRGNSIVYEVILRDRDLNRFQIELTELGHVIKEVKL